MFMAMAKSQRKKHRGILSVYMDDIFFSISVEHNVGASNHKLVNTVMK